MIRVYARAPSQLRTAERCEGPASRAVQAAWMLVWGNYVLYWLYRFAFRGRALLSTLRNTCVNVVVWLWTLARGWNNSARFRAAQPDGKGRRDVVQGVWRQGGDSAHVIALPLQSHDLAWFISSTSGWSVKVTIRSVCYYL